MYKVCNQEKEIILAPKLKHIDMTSLELLNHSVTLQMLLVNQEDATIKLLHGLDLLCKSFTN